MATCPTCGGPDGIVLFTGVSPCDGCYKPAAAQPAKVFTSNILRALGAILVQGYLTPSIQAILCASMDYGDRQSSEFMRNMLKDLRDPELQLLAATIQSGWKLAFITKTHLELPSGFNALWIIYDPHGNFNTKELLEGFYGEGRNGCSIAYSHKYPLGIYLVK